MNVGPGFFTTMQIPILLGREIGEADVGRASAGVVNEPFAKKFFGNENPIGKHFVLNAQDVEIIGVSKAARLNTLKREVEQERLRMEATARRAARTGG